jgi:hypothetical protein
MKPLIVLAFIGFLIIGYAAVFFLVKLLASGQIMIGNANSPIVKWLGSHVWHITIAVWIIFTLGIGIALPQMIKDGFFSGNI